MISVLPLNHARETSLSLHPSIKSRISVWDLETVIAAVEAGELDTVLGQMSKTAVMTKGKRAA